MYSLKINKIIRMLEIFDEMSQDLKIGKLTDVDKDVLSNIYKQHDKKQMIVNIKKINFLNFEGKPISKSTLYKSLKSLSDKNIITHLGTSRSCIYKLH